jgi:hypothetical protein
MVSDVVVHERSVGCWVLGVGCCYQLQVMLAGGRLIDGCTDVWCMVVSMRFWREE